MNLTNRNALHDYNEIAALKTPRQLPRGTQLDADSRNVFEGIANGLRLSGAALLVIGLVVWAVWL